MKFLVSSSLLLKHLQILGGIVGNNKSMPILENFLFKIKDSSLTITASDLDTAISAIIDIDADGDGILAIPAKLLLETLKTFPEQPLNFTLNEENQTVEVSSDFGKYSLAYVSGEEFPKPVDLESPSNVELKPHILNTAISKTIFVAGNDGSRPAMTGVLFHFSPEGMIFAATDAHRLVKYVRSSVVADKEAMFVMPKKPLNLLKNVLSTIDDENINVNIEYNVSSANFTIGNINLSCVLIEGKFPNYNSVIPDENPNILTLDRNNFLNSLKRVAIFANHTTFQVKLNIKKAKLKISSEDLDYSNKAEERMPCDYDGEDMEIEFNSKFFIEMLSNLESENVLLKMSSPSNPSILTPADGMEEDEDVLMLVMPVK